MAQSLPKWMWLGGLVLAFNAGTINVVGLLGFEHQAVSHLTGTTTLAASELANGDLGRSGHLLLVIAAFVAGAAISGAIVKDEVLHMGRRYGVALLIEAGLLFTAAGMLTSGHRSGVLLASCACGLQNAMASSYSGALLRTTHLTGVFTDIGVFLGHLASGLRLDHLRMKLCCLIAAGFFLGGLCGTGLFRSWSYLALVLPGSVALAAALSYAAIRLQRRYRSGGLRLDRNE